MDDFNDLEKDIAGDWLAIQKRIEAEEHREYAEQEMNRPKRLHCTYKDFYRAVHRLVYDGIESAERRNELHEILRMVLSGHGNLPEGFEKIWDAFCDSYKHDIRTVECMNCGEKYDILYKRTRPTVSYNRGDILYNMIIKHDVIYCPSCGRVLGRIEHGTLISLTTYNNIHDDRYMEERSNDIKYEF